LANLAEGRTLRSQASWQAPGFEQREDGNDPMFVALESWSEARLTRRSRWRAVAGSAPGGSSAAWDRLTCARPAPDGSSEAEARAHFKRAEAQRDKEEWREALGEYRQVLALKKTGSMMAAAVVGLRQLGQYDDALDQHDELRREFPFLSATLEAKVAPR
jgi:hypothetical protein